MKKVLSLLLVLVMLIGMMPMRVFATEGTQETDAVEVVTELTEAPEEEVNIVHEHDYEAVVTDPTCTEQGYTTYTCTCGKSYVDDYVDLTGEHSYENGVCINCSTAQSQPIIITRQPVPAMATIGEKATVFVEAEGEELVYQWYYRDSPDGALSKSTVTKNNYTLTVKATNVNRELYCVITDANGNQVTTDVVKLLQPLEATLKIIQQPVSDNAMIGEKATVFVEAEGEGLTYQWYFRNTSGGALSKSSITSNTYTTTVTCTNAQREVYCVITDGRGNQVTTDVVKLLQPLEEELKIITQPVPSNAAIGEKATISIEVQGVGLTYQWYFRNAPGGALSKSSITSSIYTTTVSKSNTQREVYCVITDGHGNQVTTNTVNLIKTEEENPTTYYRSLSDALSGTSGSPDRTGAAVKVTVESGKASVVLLQNVQLAETLTIAKGVTLDLNGFAIQSTASPVISVEAEYTTIRGGDINLTASGTGTSQSPSVAVLAKPGTMLEICDSKVKATDAENGTVVGVLAKADSELKIIGTTVIITAETSLHNVGVHAYGPATLTDCTVIAESNYTGNTAGTNYASHAYGIIGEKDLTLVNCYVWGPHSGVLAKGNVFANGGTYEGYGHGSFYFAGSNTISYIYNASVNWAEMREGTYADKIAGTNGAGMYVGNGAKNVSVYMDNCQVYGTLYGIVLRNSGGEQNNSIYISNSTVTGCSKYAYRNGQNASYKTLKVYSGVNNDYSAITGKLSANPERVINTCESYGPIQGAKSVD